MLSGVCFDDVLLVPQDSRIVSRKDIKLSSYLRDCDDMGKFRHASKLCPRVIVMTVNSQGDSGEFSAMGTVFFPVKAQA